MTIDDLSRLWRARRQIADDVMHDPARTPSEVSYHHGRADTFDDVLADLLGLDLKAVRGLEMIGWPPWMGASAAECPHKLVPRDDIVRVVIELWDRARCKQDFVDALLERYDVMEKEKKDA